MNYKLNLLKAFSVLTMLIAGLTPAFAQKNHYEVNVGEFNRINVINSVNIVWCVNPDSIGYARFFAEPRFADAFIFSNNDSGTLRIEVAADDVDLDDLPTLYLYSTFLTGVTNAGNKCVTAIAPPPCTEFKAEIIGNGDIKISDLEVTRINGKINTGNGSLSIVGTAQQANLSMIGTGQIIADELEAKKVHCTIMGTGSIYCWPTEVLSVKGIGSTKIYYKGIPANIKKRGGGKLIQLTSTED